MKKIKVSILPNYFLNDDKTFNKEEALMLSGKIAGICYDKEGFTHLDNEDVAKTKRRIDMTLNNGHHSVYDHINISFNIKNFPKILAMIINNEHQYTTSEKSARYTPVVRDDDAISEQEEILYNKWLEIFKDKITLKYGDVYSPLKIKKLAQENARYLVSVFMPTEMVYTTSLRQINYIVSFLISYKEKASVDDLLAQRLIPKIDEFISCLRDLNVLDEGLLKNEKNRSISLFGYDLENKEEYFKDTYATNYKASLAELAQAQRHRTLDYQMEFLPNKSYFVPPIIEDDLKLKEEWLHDMESVGDKFPQGELVLIRETGKYEDFILKCKERLCSCAQLEIMQRERATLLKYQDYLNKENNPLKDDIKKYTRGARCTFPDFTCSSDCHFKEGKTLTRKI